MANPLHTFQEKTSSPSIFRVYWFIDENKNGIVDVDVRQLCDDPGLIAELCALQFLYFDCSYNNGNYLTSGFGHKFVVSNPEILKLVMGVSDKSYAKRFTNQLVLRLEGIEYEVASENTIKDKITLTNKNLKFIFSDDEQFTQQYYVLNTPGIGDVHITRHALEQYKKRIESGGVLKNSFKSLIKRLKHPELQELNIEENIHLRKYIKYGNNIKTTFWSHSSSTIGFTVIEDRGRKILVTVYRRDKEFMQQKFEKKQRKEQAVYRGDYGY